MNHGKTGLQPAVTPEPSSKVNLCGAVTLPEVKALLQEWLMSTQGKWLG